MLLARSELVVVAGGRERLVCLCVAAVGEEGTAGEVLRGRRQVGETVLRWCRLVFGLAEAEGERLRGRSCRRGRASGLVALLRPAREVCVCSCSSGARLRLLVVGMAGRAEGSELHPSRCVSVVEGRMLGRGETLSVSGCGRPSPSYHLCLQGLSASP